MRLLLALLALSVACTPDDSGKDSVIVDTHAPDDTDSADTDTQDTDTQDTHDTTDTSNPTDPYEPLREAILADIADNYASGASVAIWEGGNIVFAEGFGSRHPDRQEDVTPTTLFQIGSDTKKMTAVAALQQVDRGLLSLDTTLEEGIPDLVFATDPSIGPNTNLRQLLTHTTGFFDYTPWTDNPGDDQLSAVATGRFAENQYAMNPAGEFWNYANPNFSMAGLMAERADGRYYADIMEEDVFAPLGLTRTFARQSEVEADGDYATGYGIDFEGGYDTFDALDQSMNYRVGTVEMADEPDNAFTRPAGLVWSTASDMVTFAGFLMEGHPTILSAASLTELTTPQVPLYPMAPEIGSYSFGLMIMGGFTVGRNYYEVPVWSHGGNTMTMTSTYYMLPEADMAISILSNGYGDDFTGSVAIALSTLVDRPEPSAAPEFPPAGDLSQYVGTYFDANTLGEVTLTYDPESGDLRIDVPVIEALGANVEEVVEVPYDDILVVTVEGSQYVFEMLDASDGSSNRYFANRQFVAIRQDNPKRPYPAPPNPMAGLERARIMPDLLRDRVLGR